MVTGILTDNPALLAPGMVTARRGPNLWVIAHRSLHPEKRTRLLRELLSAADLAALVWITVAPALAS